MRISVLSLAVLLFAGPSVAAAQELALETAYQSLLEAVSKKDAAQVKRLATETCTLARQVSSEPAPASQADKEAWTERVTHARELGVYSEYALFAIAAQAPAETAVDLLSTLEQLSPKSKYLDEGGYIRYFQALTQTGAASKIPAIAEKAIESLPDSLDLLLTLADNALNRGQNDRALSYGARLAAAASRSTKPEGMSDADWERKRTTALGRGYWIAGMMNAERNQFFEADRNLRAALPLIRGNNAMLGPALFSLGVANYQLGRASLNRARILEAVKFSEEAAAIPGQHAQQAWRNAQLMRNEAAKMR